MRLKPYLNNYVNDPTEVILILRPSVSSYGRMTMNASVREAYTNNLDKDNLSLASSPINYVELEGDYWDNSFTCDWFADGIHRGTRPDELITVAKFLKALKKPMYFDADNRVPVNYFDLILRAVKALRVRKVVISDGGSSTDWPIVNVDKALDKIAAEEGKYLKSL